MLVSQEGARLSPHENLPVEPRQNVHEASPKKIISGKNEPNLDI